MQTKPKKRLWIWALLIGIALSAIIIAQFGGDDESIVIRNDAEYFQILQGGERDYKDVLQKLFNEEELTDQDKDRLVKAEKVFHSLMQYAPEKFAPYLPLGMIYHALGHLDAAEQHLNRCIEYAPPLVKDKAIMETSAEAHYQLSRVLNAKGQYEHAAVESSTAIQTNPNNVNYYVGRSISYSQMKQPENARKDLQTALKLDPANAKAASLLKLLERG